MTAIPSDAPPPAPWHGALSTYAPGLLAFDGSPDLTQSVLWISGLYGTIETEGGSDLRGMEQRTRALGWGLVQSTRTSSGTGWANGSIRQDVVEIAQLIEWLVTRAKKTRVVLCGHSTGCQDIIAFFHLLKHEGIPALSAAARAAIAGSILVAPASDRQFVEMHTPAAGLAAHLSPPPDKSWDDFLTPAALTEAEVPLKTMTYRRWHSVAAPRASTAVPRTKDSAAMLAALDIDVSEDFFSTDLPDEFLRKVVFEAVEGPMGLVVPERDMTFPEGLDVEGWYGRLHAAVPEGARVAAGGVAKGADHCFWEGEAPRQLAGMVVDFLKAL